MACRLIKILCTGLLTLLWSLEVVATTPEKVLRVVTEPWPPYAYVRDGMASGLDVEIASNVLRMLGYRADIQFAPWPRALAQIQAGKADAILDISKGELNERERFLLFPSEYLSTSNSSLFYRTAEPFIYEGLPSLRGKRIAVVRGYNYSPDFMYAPYFSRDPGINHEQNLKKLVRGRVDLALMDTAVGLHLIRTNHLERQISVDPTVFISGKLYLAFAPRPDMAKLVADFERALIAYKGTSDYDQLLGRYGLTREQMRMH